MTTNGNTSVGNGKTETHKRTSTITQATESTSTTHMPTFVQPV